MEEIKRIEEIWRNLRKRMPKDQIFKMSLLLAFSGHYGDKNKIISSEGKITQESLEKSLLDIQGYDVRVALHRLSESINWVAVEEQECQKLLSYELDVFIEFYEDKGTPKEMFFRLLELAEQNGEYGVTPFGVQKLIVRLLGMRKADKLADFCCGSAGLGLALWDKMRIRNPEISFYGEECSQELCDMARLLCYCYDVNEGEIVERDVLAIPDSKEIQLYDMIVMDVPRGRNVSENYDHRDPRLLCFNQKNIYSDWIFIEDVLYRLSKNGSAAVIVTTGALIRKNEQSLREQVVANDWLEAVITLPYNLYPKNHTASELLIFNKKKARKGEVIFIDISSCCQQTGRNFSTISKEGIDTADGIFHHAEEIQGISAVCNRKQIEDNGYALKPIQYISHKEEGKLDSQIVLEEVAQIVRGAQILKKSDVDSEGEAFFLNVKDIQEHRVHYEQADRVSKFSSVCKGKFRICEDDILLTSKGTLIKAAIVTEDPPEAYISGNITRIRVDRAKYDPYVLFEYLISRRGQIALERIQSGTTIRILSNANLQQLKIPDYKLERMKAIGQKLKKNEVTYDRQKKEAEERFRQERGQLLQELEELL